MAFDFFAGCLGVFLTGFAGVVVGHPFDTVKVRLQTQTNNVYNGVFDCFKQIIKRESVLGLYKGMASPLAGLGLINAIIFGVQGETLRRLNGSGTMAQAISGAIAGGVQSIVCCPMELAKTRVQVQGQGQKLMAYTGSLDCLKKVFHSEGLRGCFRGMAITTTRDIPAFALYFGSFQYVCELLTPKGEHVDNLSPIRLFFSGGIAGTLSWILTYPVDMVKSCYQADGRTNSGKPQYKYNGYADCVKKIYISGGVSAFGQGLLATILRGFPTNAATLTVVTLTLRLARNPESHYESM
ncbi:predicted protein [Nematostella vectensis]|uniref:Mitochondrial basic amino acids transporter n=1 Tax=Nematostella vectensis TaxID=45351 RepID=A7SKV2_NEMVE|nr:predicted protein [Nematostella vectensis]|eukprot:XP_001627804.1 predicted protein [Nematostella vectensis]